MHAASDKTCTPSGIFAIYLDWISLYNIFGIMYFQNVCLWWITHQKGWRTRRLQFYSRMFALRADLFSTDVCRLTYLRFECTASFYSHFFLFVATRFRRCRCLVEEVSGRKFGADNICRWRRAMIGNQYDRYCILRDAKTLSVREKTAE